MKITTKRYNKERISLLDIFEIKLPDDEYNYLSSKGDVSIRIIENLIDLLYKKKILDEEEIKLLIEKSIYITTGDFKIEIE